ncbi:MAG: antibiotic biosynthesis monooxygenase [Dehalococcoidia bacterium]|nr:antibiotic biosynthesis monooxygenase [Dehalococcoidia bacterium]
MIVVINRLHVAADYSSHLEQAFGNARRMDNVPGCLGFEFLRNEAGGEYLVVTRWSDREAYEAWRASDSFQQAHSRTDPDSPVKAELGLYDVLTHTPLVLSR